MPTTKQPASNRRGYVKEKHTRDIRKVKQMKADARGKAKTVNRLQKGGTGDKLMAAYIAVKDAGAGKRAAEAERRLGRLRRVRFGDRKK